MGDIRILKDKLEIGIPVEEAMLLAGYSFEEIGNYEEIEEINFLVKMSKALLVDRHMTNLSIASGDKPQISQWLLEKIVPDKFGSGKKDKGPINFPKSIKLIGVYPEEEEE
jgi:hypothetical protein